MGAGKDGSFEIALCGEKLRLLPEGVLAWSAHGLLVISDFHLGKPVTLGGHASTVPTQSQKDDLERLSALLRREMPRTIVFLGDLVPARDSLDPAHAAQFQALIAEIGAETFLIGGGSTKKKEPESWTGVQNTTEWQKAPFSFRYIPTAGAEAGPLFAWTGHVHPWVELKKGSGRQRLKTFVVWEKFGLLPAFSNLSGGHPIASDARTKLYFVAEGRVLPL